MTMPSVYAGTPTPSATQLRSLAEKTRASLQADILDKWYPASVDSVHGGFLENFSEDWKPGVDNQRSIVYQSRLIWIAAKEAERDRHKRAYFKGVVRHGVSFLETKMWDSANGGFYWATDPSGSPVTNSGTGKHSYGISFAIYATSEAYRATGDPAVLSLAKRTFEWLDAHAHDSVNGGYYEALAQDGTPILTPTAAMINDEIGTKIGDKSMNTHIHILEALTNLYSVWPDPTLRSRLAEVLNIVRDRVASPSGYLTMYFKPDWTRDSHSDSYGHDVETAFLLTEASEALGLPDDARTSQVARSLVDHALRYGYDSARGGIYDEGDADTECPPTDKVWWEQAECLNALLLMYELYGAADSSYWDAFSTQWRFIEDHQIDSVHGGWYKSVKADGSPIAGLQKSDAWTDPYHQGRALINVSDRLEHLAFKIAK